MRPTSSTTVTVAAKRGDSATSRQGRHRFGPRALADRGGPPRTEDPGWRAPTPRLHQLSPPCRVLAASRGVVSPDVEYVVRRLPLYSGKHWVSRGTHSRRMVHARF